MNPKQSTQAPSPARRVSTSSSRHAFPLDQREQKKTVLVVDDEPDIVEYLSFVLAKFGYNTLTANSASEALKVVNKVGQPSPFLAIVDIVLGDENGLNLAKKLVSKAPELNVLLISGYADTVVITDPLPNGKKAGFLPKVFTSEELRNAIDQLIAT
ncbi:MAG: response regulator [Opitutaceae bacterium]